MTNAQEPRFTPTVLKSPSRLSRPFTSGLLAIALILGTTLGGCATIRRVTVRPTPISAIDSANVSDSIYIRGRVVQQLSLLGRGAYQVQDESGSIWVTTDRGVPQIDDTVTVKGIPSLGVTIGPRNFAITLTEEERL